MARVHGTLTPDNGHPLSSGVSVPWTLAVPSAAWSEIQKLYKFEDGEELIRWLVFTS